MTDSLLIQFIFAFIATCGLSIIFRVPVRKIAICGIVGALGWVVYQISVGYGLSGVIACFLGSCAVALLSDISSKIIKEAATVFIIPGIMCLVPGAGMYRAMLCLLHNDMSGFAAEGTQTVFAAGAIAVGLLVMGSFLKIVRTLVKKVRTVFGQ